MIECVSEKEREKEKESKILRAGRVGERKRGREWLRKRKEEKE